MHAFGLVAPDRDAATTLRDRLVDGLAQSARVGVVDAGATSPTGPRAVREGATTYCLAEDEWVGRGPGGSVREALERLAPDHEYAVVLGAPETRIPHAVVGEVEYQGQRLIEAPTVDAVSAADVVTALSDVTPFETLESLVAAVKRSPDADRSGAIATFTGRVRRRDDPDDVETTHLEFEKYAGVADERMDEIAAELAERDGVHDVVMHHRTGVIEAGEDIVFVVVLAGHRTEAFRTVEDGIDRLKAEVPIFKKEVTREESYWVHDGQ